MNLDELRSVQSKERRKDSLQQLRDSFYEDVATYISDLRTTRDRRAEQVSNPFSDDEVRRLSDELETAEEVAEAVFERRVGKVVKLASFAAADMSVGTDGMTGEERDLFDDLVSRIKRNKRDVLDILAGDDDTPVAHPAASESSPPTASDGASTPKEVHPDAPTHSSPDIDHEPAHGEQQGDVARDGENVLAAAMGSTENQSGAETTPSDSGGVDSDESASKIIDSDESASKIIDSDESSSTDETTGVPTTDGGNTTAEPTSGRTEPASERNDHSDPPLHETGPTSQAADATVSRSKESDNPTKTGLSSEKVESPNTEPERTMVRITEDVGEIFGVDEREYTLGREDVVTLPTANAEPLVARDAAIRLD